MAELNSDRGQIILLAAFALAVTFLAFGVLTNSAIFTENLASRGETTGSGAALESRATTEANLGRGLEAANRAGGSISTFKKNMRDISVQTEALSAPSGALINITYAGSESGKKLKGNIDGPTDNNYTVVEKVKRDSNPNATRSFVINASASDFPTASDSPFVIRANQSGDSTNANSWRAMIYEDSGDIVVRTNRSMSSGFANEICRVPVSGTRYKINITAGKVEDKLCSALTRNSSTGTAFWFSTGANPSDTYDIRFENTDAGGGVDARYSMIVNNEDPVNLPTPSAINSETTVIYSVTTTFTYDGPKVEYDTKIRVAPGEPDA